MVPADPRRCPPRLPLPLQALVSLPCYIHGTGAGRVFGCNTLHGMLGAHDSRHTRCVVYGPRALVSARFSVGGRGVCCRVSCHRQARRLTSECARTAAHPGTQMHTWVLKCTACTTYTLHSCENGGYQITDKIIMYRAAPHHHMRKGPSPGYGDPCMCISHGSASLSFSQGCPAAMLPIMSGGASWARQITFCASRNAPNLQGRRILRWLQLRKTGRWGGPRSREASSGGAMVRKSRSGSTGNFSGQIQQHDL